LQGKLVTGGIRVHKGEEAVLKSQRHRGEETLSAWREKMDCRNQKEHWPDGGGTIILGNGSKRGIGD